MSGDAATDAAELTCPVCGAVCTASVAVEVCSEGAVRQVCSSRCADTLGSDPPAKPVPALPRRILVAVDGSGPSLRAAEYAAGLAHHSGGSVVLLHAIDELLLRGFDLLSGAERAIDLGVRADEVERMLREDAQAQLDGAARRCREAGVRCETRIALQPALKAVEEAARDSDLVVIGSRGRGALAGTLLGSLSQRVIGALSTPVLVVH